MKRILLLGIFLLSGAALAMAFPPYDMPWLAWVAVAPALVAAASAPFGLAAAGGFLFGLAMTELLLGWFLALFGAFGFSLHVILALFFAFAFGAVQQAARRWGPSALPWAAPVIWVGVEFFRSECWPLKFSWFGLGYSQHANLPFLQLASIGGVYLLSLVIAGTNGALAWFLLAPSKRRLARLLAAGIAVGAMQLAGLAMMRPAEGDFEIAGIEGEKEPVSRFLDESGRILDEHPAVRLVVWPEYAVPAQLSGKDGYSELISGFARSRGVHVLFGATRAAGEDFENTIFLFDSAGRIAATQVKSVPVQFMQDGLPAKTREPMRLADGVLLGAAVCYDMDFPYVTRELAAKGAQLLAYPTMDVRGWGETQHRQHASIAAVRAVEHRRWLARVVSSGHSRIVDPYGRVTQSTGIGETTLHARVGLRNDRTLCTRYGFLVPNACLLAAVAIMIVSVRKGRPRAV